VFCQLLLDHLAVVLDDPHHEVGRPLAGGLWSDPQFEVLGSIIISDAVDVVDVLMVFKRTTEHPFHNETVAALPSTPMTLPDLDVDIALAKVAFCTDWMCLYPRLK
jgi:hypothetical protein